MSDVKERLSHIEDVDSTKSYHENPDDVPKIAKQAAENHELQDGNRLLELQNIVGPNRAEQEKKLVRKLDIRLLPMLMIIYVLNYLDRNNIATARLDNLEEDTGLHGTQYNTVISVFYVGYVLTQVFSNLLLTRLRPSILLPSVMVLWATVSTCCGAVQNYSGWVAIRFILGFVESPYFAGSIFLMSSWYTKKELATRISILYTASQFSGAFGGLIGQAILNRFQYDNKGIEAWRWLFIIEGTITIPFAVLAMLIIPDFPHNSKHLNEKERALAQLRMLEEASKEDNYDEKLLDGLKQAFLDPTLYMLWIIQLALVTAATVNAYFPTIVGTLGYGRTKTLLLTVPPWVVSAIWSIATSLSSDRHNERFWHIVVSLLVAMVGFIIAACTMQIAARYVSMILMLMIYGAFTTALAWISTTINRPPAKRSVAYGFINAFSNVSSTYASYFYPKSTGPKYFPAMICNIAFTLLAIIMAVVLRFYLQWRNRRMDRANEEDLATEGTRIGSRTQALAKRFDCDPHYRFAL